MGFEGEIGGKRERCEREMKGADAAEIGGKRGARENEGRSCGGDWRLGREGEV